MKHKKQVISFGLIALIIGISFTALLFYVHWETDRRLSVQGGRIDLSDWEQQPDRNLVSLTGEWEFYWKRLVTDKELREGVKPDLLVTAPKVWNRYRINGKGLGGTGFGTYRLHVTGIRKGEPLALWIPTFSTAYRIYIDGKLLAANGVVSAYEKDGKPEYRLNQVCFTPSGNSLDMIIQVSNYTYARGGMWGTLYLGTPKRIESSRDLLLFRDSFLLGSFFVMAFIYGSLFFFRRREKSHIFFSALCGMIAVRTLLHGSYLFKTFFPFLGFSAIIRADYMTLYWIPILLGLLFQKLFPDEIHQKALKIFTGYAVFMTALTLLTPVSFFTSLIYGIEIMIFIISGYLFIRMCAAVFRDRIHAALIMTGGLVVLECCVFDILFQNNIVNAGLLELTPIGFFLMLLGQAHVLAESFAETIRKKEETLLQLQASLERERKSELKFLKSQIRPHFIHNALNTILSISRKDVPRSQELLVEFSSYLRGCFDFKNLEDMIPIEKELEFIRSYLSLEQARFGDRLKVRYDIDDQSVRVPPLILQPLVENAVIHGIRPKPDGGNILVYVKRVGDAVKIGVMDDGDGIPPERIEKLIAGKESGRGVGIYNITRRLKKIYHISLCIQNRDTGGSAGTPFKFQETTG
ncbi:hypothetical protein A7X67_11870 [Clostridium sp. W14A]|nr:hypothetical protein A7X67_11870 [Clostridium sp. W14A]